MDTEEIMKLCERLARRFNQPHHYDDMVSEGVLKCLDMLSSNKEEHPAKIYREAKRRMHDYINFDCHGLTVPASDAARATVRGNDTSDRDDYSERGLELLREALNSEWGSYEEDILEGDHKTGEELTIEHDLAKVVNQAVASSLDEEETQVIALRYFEDATQDEVSVIMGLSQQGVSLREKKALRKLRLALCNIL